MIDQDKTKQLGLLIADRRIEANIERAEIASTCKISVAYLGMIERGEVTPPTSTLLKIFAAIDIDSAIADQWLEIAAESRGLCKEDAGLSDELVQLMIALRRASNKLPERFVKELRRMVREIS